MTNDAHKKDGQKALPYVVRFVTFSTSFVVIIALALVVLHFAVAKT